MIRTEMGRGDHITKHGTHISRDMGPGGGPYISNDMAHVTREMGPGGGGGGPISLLHSSELATSSQYHYIANLIVVAIAS